jgi:hypothetical protein
MIEPTITQNGALYFAQHRTPRRQATIFGARVPAAARKDQIIIKQQRAFENLFLWLGLHRADK